MAPLASSRTHPIPLLGLAHIGIRVHDMERSTRFYEMLGFTRTLGPIGPEPVAVLVHPCGLEINDGMEHAVLEPPPRQFGEEALDGIEP